VVVERRQGGGVLVGDIDEGRVARGHDGARSEAQRRDSLCSIRGGLAWRFLCKMVVEHVPDVRS
jgi:hypothetical protein